MVKKQRRRRITPKVLKTILSPPNYDVYLGVRTNTDFLRKTLDQSWVSVGIMEFGSHVFSLDCMVYSGGLGSGAVGNLWYRLKTPNYGPSAHEVSTVFLCAYYKVKYPGVYVPDTLEQFLFDIATMWDEWDDKILSGEVGCGRLSRVNEE